MKTIEERVQAGIRLLDAREPHWREKIRLRGLRLDHYRRCVLGQVFGRYNSGIVALGLNGNAADFGFYAYEPRWTSVDEYAALDTAWKSALKPKPRWRFLAWR